MDNGGGVGYTRDRGACIRVERAHSPARWPLGAAHRRIAELLTMDHECRCTCIFRPGSSFIQFEKLRTHAWLNYVKYTRFPLRGRLKPSATLTQDIYQPNGKGAEVQDP